MSNILSRLCDSIHITPPTKMGPDSELLNLNSFSGLSHNERMTTAVRIFLLLLDTHQVNSSRVDQVLIDHMLVAIDESISFHLSEILHHPEFQQCESNWLSINKLVKNIQPGDNSKIFLASGTKEEFYQDFESAIHPVDSSLYSIVYTSEFDTPGGEPYSAILSEFEFSAEQHDIKLLTHFSKISAAAHCPFIANTNPAFFQQKNYQAILDLPDLHTHMDQAAYRPWHAFRESEDARYIGLVLPKYLLRLPYGGQNPVKRFGFKEQVNTHCDEHFLWGPASFALGLNLQNSFRNHGWLLNIRGPESGGMIKNLDLYYTPESDFNLCKPPVNITLSETQELNLARAGFISLSYYKNTNYACFFSANSTQAPFEYHNPTASANSRINSRLPYVLLSSRIAHYLKILQRENIGSSKNAQALESELNKWLQTLVTKMNNPSPDTIASHPLRDAHVEVTEREDNPGFYKIHLYCTPHFQVEGLDIQLSLVSKMPKQLN